MWVSFWLRARLVSRALNETCEYALWASILSNTCIYDGLKKLCTHEKRKQLVKDIRKASKVLKPWEKPFFSPKAPSSKPWSTKPFIWSCLDHRSINLRGVDIVCDSFLRLLQVGVEDDEDDSYSKVFANNFSPMKLSL